MRAIHNIQITPIAQSSQSRCWLQAISRLCWCTLSQKSSLKHKDNTNKSTKKLNVFNKFYCFVFSKSIFFCLPISIFVFLCSFSSLFDWMDSFSFFFFFLHVSDQIRSVTQSCLTLCDPMNRSMPGLPVHHQLPEFTQTHVHRVSDAIQPSHPLSSSSPPAPNPSQHQSLFQ